MKSRTIPIVLPLLLLSHILGGCQRERTILCGERCATLRQELKHNGCLAHLVWDPAGKAIRVKADYEDCGLFIPFTQTQTLRDFLLVVERARPQLMAPEVVDSVELTSAAGERTVVKAEKFFQAEWQRSRAARDFREMEILTTICGRPFRSEEIVYGGGNTSLLKPMVRWEEGDTVGLSLQRLAWSDSTWPDFLSLTLLRREAGSPGRPFRVVCSGPPDELRDVATRPFDALLFFPVDSPGGIGVAGEALAVSLESAGIEPEPGECPIGVRRFPVSERDAAVVTEDGKIAPVVASEFCQTARAGNVVFFPPRTQPPACIPKRPEPASIPKAGSDR